MHSLIVVAAIVAFAAVAIAGHYSAMRRRAAMAEAATSLGLFFRPHKDRRLAQGFSFLNVLRAGRDRYAFNILSGTYRGHNVTAFDYHYKTGSGKDTHHHYFSFFVLEMSVVFTELTIAPEGFFSKVAQAFGYDDIDFESHEFSRRFCVRAKDKKFAYGVCNAQMIEYLLANPDLTIEIDAHALAISFSRRLKPRDIGPNLERLVAVRSLMPEYLFSRS